LCGFFKGILPPGGRFFGDQGVAALVVSGGPKTAFALISSQNSGEESPVKTGQREVMRMRKPFERFLSYPERR